MGRNRALLLVLLCTGIIAATLGQLYLVCRRELYRDGLLLWSIAIVSFGLLIRISRQSASTSRTRQIPFLCGISKLRIFGVVSGVVLVAVVGIWAMRRGSDRDFSVFVL